MPSKSPRTHESLIDRVWYGDDVVALTLRALLSPVEAAYRTVAAVRGRRYDSGAAPAEAPPIPAISIGNLTVGGTGKTPIAAWIASSLRDRGARPAIVLRGYGGDESMVHRQLNPGVPVFETVDRLAGVRQAVTDAGADVAVLDDAFQHRRVRRLIDVVVVSADRWPEQIRLLPAGPWREPLTAVRRANLIMVTRKAVGPERAEEVHQELSRVAPHVARLSIQLVADTLVRFGSDEAIPVSAVSGRKVHLFAAIGDPRALIRQLAGAGADVVADLFRDHHAFTDAEIERIALGRRAEADAAGAFVLCTLKDAVKVGTRWPREGPPLWYVSQRVRLERGIGDLERVLDNLLRARHPAVPTAG